MSAVSLPSTSPPGLEQTLRCPEWTQVEREQNAFISHATATATREDVGEHFRADGTSLARPLMGGLLSPVTMPWAIHPCPTSHATPGPEKLRHLRPHSRSDGCSQSPAGYQQESGPPQSCDVTSQATIADRRHTSASQAPGLERVPFLAIENLYCLLLGCRASQSRSAEVYTAAHTPVVIDTAHRPALDGRGEPLGDRSGLLEIGGARCAERG